MCIRRQVQVLRFCGLLEESVEAHRRAVDLDPTVATSVSHTLFLMGDYPAAIDSYGGRTGYYLDAAAWAAVGDTDRTARVLRDRLAQSALSELMSGLMTSLLAVVERRFDDAFRCMQAMKITCEPEALTYLARHYSYIGASNAAIDMLRRAMQSGFVCAAFTLCSDPWLEAARRDTGFASVLAEAESLAGNARSLFSTFPSI
jgi:hypothetical protein